MSLKNDIPLPTLKRLTLYRHLLLNSQDSWVSTTFIEKSTGVKSITIRKDINYIGVKGIPQKGFNREYLLNKLTEFISPENNKDIILIGRWGIGEVILKHKEYIPQGFRIIACFDNIESKQVEWGVPIYPMDKMSDLISRLGLSILFTSLNEKDSKKIIGKLSSLGIRNVLNLSPFFIAGDKNLKVINYSLQVPVVDFLTQ